MSQHTTDWTLGNIFSYIGKLQETCGEQRVYSYENGLICKLDYEIEKNMGKEFVNILEDVSIFGALEVRGLNCIIATCLVGGDDTFADLLQT